MNWAAQLPPSFLFGWLCLPDFILSLNPETTMKIRISKQLKTQDRAYNNCYIGSIHDVLGLNIYSQSVFIQGIGKIVLIPNHYYEEI